MKKLVLAVAGVSLVATVLLAACQGGDTEQLTGPNLPAAQTAGLAPGSTPEDLSQVHCGVERWGTKTLSDPDVGLVNFVPVPATIDQLRAIPAPPTLPTVGRVKPAELATYTVSGVVTDWKAESDGDFHLVLSDPTNHHTMIIESSDAAHCVRAAPQLRAEMAKARADILAALGQPSATGFVTVNRAVTVTGVAFLDRLHSQRGVAPNGAEIHPILQIEFK